MSLHCTDCVCGAWVRLRWRGKKLFSPVRVRGAWSGSIHAGRAGIFSSVTGAGVECPTKKQQKKGHLKGGLQIYLSPRLCVTLASRPPSVSEVRAAATTAATTVTATGRQDGRTAGRQ